MITRTSQTCQDTLWQRLLIEAITDPYELLNLLELDTKFFSFYEDKKFKLRVPRGFVSRMRRGDFNDPLLRQVLPCIEESYSVPGFHVDPLHEARSNHSPGLLHKYKGRVLLILTGACAVHCRYCFRRHFPYSNNMLNQENLKKIIDYVSNDRSIQEIILSGGDPLVINDDRLYRIIEKIEKIKHIKTLRIHSRLPVVLPERITQALLTSLTQTRLKVVMVIHSNHPNEIDSDVRIAMKKLQEQKIVLLNQSVLLRGVNDSASVLSKLSETLFDIGVLPYYLHLLDKVAGSAHFDVDESIARALVFEMMQQLPGYLVPKLVRENSQLSSKEPISIL